MSTAEKTIEKPELYSFSKGDPSHPAVVCLHGLLGAARNLSKLVDRLANEGYFAIAYDQRGHSHSPHQADGVYTLDLLARDVFQVLDQYQVERAHLVGHSMGGRVCLSAYALAPERIRSLSLLDVGFRIHQGALDEITGIVGSLPEGFASRAEAETELPRLLPRSETPAAQLVAFLASNLRSSTKPEGPRMVWSFDLAGIRKSLLAAINLDQVQTWQSVQCPTLLLRGARSAHFTQVEFDEMLSLNAHCRGSLVSNAGHWLHVDNFPETSQKIIEFLRGARS